MMSTNKYHNHYRGRCIEQFFAELDGILELFIESFFLGIHVHIDRILKIHLSLTTYISEVFERFGQQKSRTAPTPTGTMREDAEEFPDEKLPYGNISGSSSNRLHMSEGCLYQVIHRARFMNETSHFVLTGRGQIP